MRLARRSACCSFAPQLSSMVIAPVGRPAQSRSHDTASGVSEGAALKIEGLSLPEVGAGESAADEEHP